MTSITDEALARIDGYHDGSAEHARLQAMESMLRGLRLDAQVGPAFAAYKQSLYGTEPREVIAAYRRWKLALEDANILLEAEGEIRNERASLRLTNEALGPDATAPALSWLHEQLQTLLTEVKAADIILGGIQTPEAALQGTSEQVTAWQTVTAATHTYEEIRSAQKRISGKVSGNDPIDDALFYRLLENHGMLSNAYDVESEYISDRQRNGRLGETNGRYAAFVDWRSDVTTHGSHRDPRKTWPSNEGREAHLRRIAREGHAWVPTIQQLEKIGQLVDAMRQQLLNLSDLRHALDAHDAYFRDRHISPRVALNADAIRAALPDDERRRPTRRRALDPLAGR